MKTRRVRRAVSKIDHWLENEGIEENTTIRQSFNDFKKAFTKEHFTRTIMKARKKKIERLKAAKQPDIIKEIRKKADESKRRKFTTKINGVNYILRKKSNFFFWTIGIEWKSAHNTYGRFGSGWNWVVGLQIGKTAIILNLLVLSIYICKKIEEKK